jgi:hypothetical protein
MTRAYEKAELDCWGEKVVTNFEPKAAARDGELGLQRELPDQVAATDAPCFDLQ